MKTTIAILTLVLCLSGSTTYACEQVIEYDRIIGSVKHDFEQIRILKPTFKERINQMIKEGWQPLGGIAIWTTRFGNNYAQAMVKCSTTNQRK